LITSLRTAVDVDGTFDKESASYNHIFDAFRFSLNLYSFNDAMNVKNMSHSFFCKFA
jgi:hypothetical protein